MTGRVDLAPNAARDLDRLDYVMRGRVRRVLGEGLSSDPLPANLDVRPLAGASPWLRIRVGDYRIICRPLTGAELRAGEVARVGYLVDRIVHRRDLPRTVRQL